MTDVGMDRYEVDQHVEGGFNMNGETVWSPGIVVRVVEAKGSGGQDVTVRFDEGQPRNTILTPALTQTEAPAITTPAHRPSPDRCTSPHAGHWHGYTGRTALGTTAL